MILCPLRRSIVLRIIKHILLTLIPVVALSVNWLIILSLLCDQLLKLHFIAYQIEHVFFLIITQMIEYLLQFAMTLFFNKLDGLTPFDFDHFELFPIFAVTRNPHHLWRQLNCDQKAKSINYSHPHHFYWLHKLIIDPSLLVHLCSAVPFGSMAWPIWDHEWEIRHYFHHVLLLGPISIKLICVDVGSLLLQSFE